MNIKRNYPLFIIDNSRSHGRGVETDYISCTSNDLPFIAQVTLHNEKEYAELYDAEDICAMWSDPRQGIRMRIQVVSVLHNDYDKTQLRSLLRRALKEMLLRRQSHSISVKNVKDEDVVAWADTFLDGVRENLRECPGDNIQKMHLAVLEVIKERFTNK